MRSQALITLFVRTFDVRPNESIAVWMNDWIYAIERCMNVAWRHFSLPFLRRAFYLYSFMLLFLLNCHCILILVFISIVGCTAPNSNSSMPCNGHGKCETKENGQNCMCYYGFTGPYCEHSECFVISFFLNCPNNNSLWLTVHCTVQFVLQWIYGTTNFLSADLNDCLPNPCKNNGMCLDGDGKFTCKCAPGWSGKLQLFCFKKCAPMQRQTTHSKRFMSK